MIGEKNLKKTSHSNWRKVQKRMPSGNICHAFSIYGITLMAKHRYFIVSFVIIFYIFYFCLNFVNSEQCIYYWDYSFYWLTSNLLANGAINLKHFFLVLNNDDYNFTPILLQGLIARITSTDRSVFVLSTIVLYFIPFCIIFLKLLGRFVCDLKTKFLIFSFIIAATPFIKPILIGYPDISGLVFVLLAIFLCTQYDLAKINFKTIIFLGTILYIPFMFRRWYAYTIVSLYITLPLLNFFIFYNKKKSNLLHHLLSLFITFFLCGVVSLCFAFSLQGNLCKRILNTSYADMYSAYRLPVSESLYFVIDSIGLWMLPLFIVAMLLLFKRGYNKEKSLIIFSIANLLIIFFFFLSTQSPGIQHQQPFSLFIYIISCLGLIHAAKLIKIYKNLILLLPVIFISIAAVTLFHRNFLTTFYDEISFLKYNIILNKIVLFPVYCYDNEKFDIKKDIYMRDGRLCNNGEQMFTVFPLGHTPMRAEDINEYKKLLDFVETKIDDSDKIYFLSSSEVFNGNMLVSLGGLGNSKKFIPEQHVDFRDGPPFDLLKADYVVVADPIQTHLKKGQMDIIIPAYSFIKKTDISNSYQEIPINILLSRFGERIQIHIFKKIRPFNEEDLRIFFDKFYTAYPEWRKIHGENISWAIGKFQSPTPESHF